MSERLKALKAYSHAIRSSRIEFHSPAEREKELADNDKEIEREEKEIAMNDYVVDGDSNE